MTITISPEGLSLSQLRNVRLHETKLVVSEESRLSLHRGAEAVATIARRGEPAYGINTGFGRLATTHISYDQIELLQENLVLSHAVGVGDPFPDDVVRLMLVLKVASLCKGYSGATPSLVDALIALLNHDIIPVIPSKGSVGASGDLAPLAHLASVLLGIGEVRVGTKKLTAKEGLALAGLSPLKLKAKEGLALLNGTQASTALALVGLFALEDVFRSALVAGALSLDAAAGSISPFDERIHLLRGHKGQIDVAKTYRQLLSNSRIGASHVDCEKVQDPYSLRCQPQVMGACLDIVRGASLTLLTEANAVSDNPLIFPDTLEVLSGGNFHGEPVAFASDILSLAASEVGALSERRIALLIDSTLSGLPPFLVRDGGVNSGFMIAHVTAASLASENKTLAHPASVDSLPTSANQEDHVSMSTFAARKLRDIVDNVAGIVAIELLAACQGVELREPLTSSPLLTEVIALIRKYVPHYDIDHYLAPDIQSVIELVKDGAIAVHCPMTVTEMSN